MIGKLSTYLNTNYEVRIIYKKLWILTHNIIIYNI